MAVTYDNVIVFGPTGAVGGSTALEASKRGAKVWLAMRDPSKTIETIPEDVEKSGKFVRVKADLTDPDSVAEAAKKSGAKAAYVYVVFGSPDHMRGSLQALKDSGVEYVVLLSSVSVAPGKDLRSFNPEEFISYTHAQAELAVEEVGFPYFTALRPATFASNHFKMVLDKSSKPPKADFVFADSYVDNIVPEDIGAVGGAVLVERPSSRKEIIYLCGPELVTFEEAWATIKRVTGRDDIDCTPPSSKEDWLTSYTKRVPLPVAQEILSVQERGKGKEAYLSKEEYQRAVGNIKKFAGREPTTFEDYLKAHKAEWQSF